MVMTRDELKNHYDTQAAFIPDMQRLGEQLLALIEGNLNIDFDIRMREGQIIRSSLHNLAHHCGGEFKCLTSETPT